MSQYSHGALNIRRPYEIDILQYINDHAISHGNITCYLVEARSPS